MIVAGNGSDRLISGGAPSRWDNDEPRELRRIEGSDFEVVDSGALPRPDGG